MKRRWVVSVAVVAAVVFLLAFTVRRAAAQEENGTQGQGVEAQSESQPASAAEPVADSPVINELLDQALMYSAQLDVDADALVFLERWPDFRETHGVELNTMKGHINELGKLEARMRAVRDSGSPWQQNAVDQIRPLLEQLAGNMEAAIANYNQDRHMKPMGKHANYLQANADLAARLRALIKDAVQYRRSKGVYDSLSTRMEPSK